MNNTNTNNMDLPMGFGMALAQNQNAMTNFSAMSSEQKQSVINSTKQIKSKKEMKGFVSNLASTSNFDGYNYDNYLQ